MMCLWTNKFFVCRETRLPLLPDCFWRSIKYQGVYFKLIYFIHFKQGGNFFIENEAWKGKMLWLMAICLPLFFRQMFKGCFCKLDIST